MENNSKSIRKNYIYNLGYQILAILAPLITTPIVSRSLTAEGVGTYGYIYSIVSYFVMVSILGSSTFGQRETSYVQNDTHNRSVVFFETLLFRAITCASCCIIYIIFVLFQSENRAVYFIMTFLIVAVVTDVSWFFQGLEEFGKIIRRSVLIKIINIALIVIFIKDTSDLFLYAFILAVIPCIGNVTLWFYLPAYLTRINIKEIHLKSVLYQSFSLFIPTVAIQVYTVLDKIMIGIITHQATEIGYYEQAEKISKMAVAIVTSLSTVMIPRIGYYFANDEKDKLYHTMYRAYRFSWLICTPLCIGMAVVSRNLVPWFFGVGYEKVVPLMWILSLLIPALGLSNISGMQYLIPTKRQKQYTISVSICALINLICNSFMIPLWGAMGAAIASVIAEISVVCIQLFLVRKELSFKQIISSGWKYYLAGFAMGIVLYIEQVFFKAGILYSFTMIITGVIVYAGILAIIKDDFFLENTYGVINRVLKRKS